MKEELKKLILQIESAEELHEVYELMKRMQTHLKGVAAAEFKLGDKVFFISRKSGAKIVGKIIKINSTTISLDCGQQGRWKVTPTLLKKEE